MSGATPLRRLGRAAVVLALCLVIPACGKNKVTKANYDKITVGMTLQEVEGILGQGTKDEGGDGSGVAAQFGVHIPVPERGKSRVETYVWEKGNRSIKVFILDGKVTNKGQEGL
jgi:hypothetical protein